MLKKEGVYTVECPKCKNFTITHLESNGSICPHMCSKCQQEFRGIDSGKQRNSFVAIAKEAKEIKKTEEESSKVFSLTKKSNKKSFKW
jgi:hypothetical protein